MLNVDRNFQRSCLLLQIGLLNTNLQKVATGWQTGIVHSVLLPQLTRQLIVTLEKGRESGALRPLGMQGSPFKTQGVLPVLQPQAIHKGQSLRKCRGSARQKLLSV